MSSRAGASKGRRRATVNASPRGAKGSGAGATKPSAPRVFPTRQAKTEQSARRVFTTRLEKTEDGIGTFIRVPFDVKAELGRARLPVIVTVRGHTYRSTTAVYGGACFLPFRRELRERAGAEAGDTISVMLEADTAPRRVELPKGLQKALRRVGALEAWSTLSYSHQRELADAILKAKRPQTRSRRIEAAVRMLTERPTR